MAMVSSRSHAGSGNQHPTAKLRASPSMRNILDCIIESQHYNCRMNGLELKIPPPLVALFLAVLMRLIPALAGSVAVQLGLRLGVALALLCLGLSIAVSGVVAFRRARTTLNPIKASSASALVNSGVYRFTRNPMYLGLLLALLRGQCSCQIRWHCSYCQSMCCISIASKLFRKNAFSPHFWDGVFGLQRKCSPLAVRLNASAHFFLMASSRD